MEVLIQLIPAQKTCTIRCDYSEVAERHDTYQQFKCSKSTYDIKGGHV